MWVKGLWIKQEYKKICEYCKEEFTCTHPSRRYCIPEHLTLDRKNKVADTLEKYISYMLLHKRRECLSIQDILDLYEAQEGRCALSGIEMTYICGQGRIPTNIGIDRIEHQGPYIKENIRLVCNYVNTMRLDRTDEEFMWWCRKIIATCDSKC